MCHWWFPKYTLQFWTRKQTWTIGRGDILRKLSCSPSILNILNCVLGYPLGNSYTRLIWVDYNPITNHPFTNFQQNIQPNILVAVASIFGVPSNLFHQEILCFFQKKTFDTMRCDSKQFLKAGHHLLDHDRTLRLDRINHNFNCWTKLWRFFP